VAAEIYFNVAVSGLLTGLVYGLMAVGLSVIFGVVRVVNFAHGEMMTIAMYLAIVLFSGLALDPLVMVVPLAAVLFALGYAMQAGIINPFITRPEYSQFILLVAVAIIITNGSSPRPLNSTMARYMAMVIISPWAKLTTRTTPKMTERPTAIRP